MRPGQGPSPHNGVRLRSATGAIHLPEMGATDDHDGFRRVLRPVRLRDRHRSLPVWKRLRDERPLYYNEKYDFYAVSRFDDVDHCSMEWETYISSKGTLLELIKSDMEIPPGSIIFEDPPTHHIHRRLLSRVFTPRNISDLEPKIREFCARSLDPLDGAGDSTSSGTSGAQMPMRTIGMLLGIPEERPRGHPRPHRRRPSPDRERHARPRRQIRRRRPGR